MLYPSVRVPAPRRLCRRSSPSRDLRAKSTTVAAKDQETATPSFPAERKGESNRFGSDRATQPVETAEDRATEAPRFAGSRTNAFEREAPDGAARQIDAVDNLDSRTAAPVQSASSTATGEQTYAARPATPTGKSPSGSTAAALISRRCTSITDELCETRTVCRLAPICTCRTRRHSGGYTPRSARPAHEKPPTRAAPHVQSRPLATRSRSTWSKMATRCTKSLAVNWGNPRDGVKSLS